MLTTPSIYTKYKHVHAEVKMVNANNKQSNGLISNAFGVAKKFSSTGLELLNHVAPDSVTKTFNTDHAVDNTDHAVDGSAKVKSPFASKKYENPKDMLREHLPNVSRQLLGRRFNTVNNVAHFVSPQLADKVSDYFYNHLNQFSNQMSSVDAILNEAGAKDLEELTQDTTRSQRISQAFAEQNKWMATVQGAVSGVTGVLGTAIDIPASLLMALRTIYQVGRSYGFDLSKEDDQEIVQHIFRQIDLSLIAEKQALLMGLKALSSTLKTHDLSQLQTMLGSSNDVETLKKWLSNQDGSMKWVWMNHFPKLSLLEQLTKLTPLASAGIGAVYSHRFVNDVNQKAQEVFSNARQYLLQHRDSSVSVLEAYQKSRELLQQAAPKLLNGAAQADKSAPGEPILDQEIPIEGNKNITQVKVVKKTDQPVAEEEKDEQVSEGLNTLADQLVEPVADKHVQQPALSEPVPEDIEDTLAEAEQEHDSGSENEDQQQADAQTADAPEQPKATAKSTAKNKTKNVTKDADPSQEK